jgi:WhiB family redox-sensing transcriptional regulator
MAGRWQERAACDGRFDIDWFPLKVPGRTPASITQAHARYHAQIREALAVCARCPVRTECLQAALEDNEPGIRGGTTEDERRVLHHRTVA